ncbi:2Fe-2S iron-sulfur cluster-binding protein [Salaquimonas pukyongi]|uniref:2Fe-2S iron-sulfur cluster-binding protein n=1 Tax=Salaquimonas pukyongi TaxID=2712698 RepID=UPI00096B7B6F|nr:2Fe-2S iron-sulfur cluster-binding protein [Salaquimonas pukyongi]
MATSFHSLTVSSVAPEGESAKAVGFLVPDELKDTFRFIPGQYLTLKTEIDGEEIRRSYSICSAPGDAELRVGIKKVEGGRFSTFAQALAAGDRIEVMPPEGRFTAEPGKVKKPLLIAAGSGVTPILSIARALLERDREAEVTLVYGNRTTSDIMFRESLEELKDRFMDRFSLVFVLSREDQDVDISNGRIDADKLKLLAGKGLIDPAAHDGIYLCGPQAMTETCSAVLQEMGVDKDRIRFELFTPADGGTIAPVRRREQEEKAAGDVVVETVLDGARRSFRMNGKEAKVLDAAHEAGIELPFSCAGGMCCTCRCRVVEGKAEMDVNYSLQPWEIEAGFTLACQSRPLSKKLVLDFDAS